MESYHFMVWQFGLAPRRAATSSTPLRTWASSPPNSLFRFLNFNFLDKRKTPQEIYLKPFTKGSFTFMITCKYTIKKTQLSLVCADADLTLRD